jgi:putative endonuclease
LAIERQGASLPAAEGFAKQSPVTKQSRAYGKVSLPTWPLFGIATSAFGLLAMTRGVKAMSSRQYAVYILTNSRHSVLYTGVTNNLERRIREHKSGKGSQFTRQYNAHMLVYYELGDDVGQAIFREKQLKAGSRQDKIALINGFNPEWKDLSEKLFNTNTNDLVIARS